jgi:hypothetical protein
LNENAPDRSVIQKENILKKTDAPKEIYPEEVTEDD